MCLPRAWGLDVQRGVPRLPGFTPSASGKSWERAGALGKQALEGVSVTCALGFAGRRAELGTVPADAQISNLFHDDNRLLIQ